MTDREFIKVLKSSIRPDDDSFFISKETLLDAIEVMERQQGMIMALAEGQARLHNYIKKLKEEARQWEEKNL